MTTVRCPACHRIERWRGDGSSAPSVEVIVPGGDRRAPDHPGLAAWGILMRSRHGQLGAIVGACPACGQPLVVTEGAWAALPSWRIDTPEGAVVVGERVTGPEGAFTEEEAEKWLRKRLGAKWTAGFLANQVVVSTMLLTFVLPFALWILGAIYAFFFVYMGLSTF